MAAKIKWPGSKPGPSAGQDKIPGGPQGEKGSGSPDPKAAPPETDLSGDRFPDPPRSRLALSFNRLFHPGLHGPGGRPGRLPGPLLVRLALSPGLLRGRPGGPDQPPAPHSRGLAPHPRAGRRPDPAHGPAHLPDHSPAARPLGHRRRLYPLADHYHCGGRGSGGDHQQRTWCYLCPIGTMSNWVGKNRRPLTLASEHCLECSLCAKNCPMQLSPAALKDQPAMAHRGDCLKCRLCVTACPSAALTFADDRTTGDAA